MKGLFTIQVSHLELHDEIHPVLAERVDVVQDERDDDVDAV